MRNWTALRLAGKLDAMSVITPVIASPERAKQSDLSDCFVVATLLLAMTMSLSSYAYADMIEIKDEGFSNGEVVSETADEVVFKDSHGVKPHVAKKDVLHLEKEKKDNLKFAKNAGSQIQAQVAKLTHGAPKLPTSMKVDVDKLKKKNALDRSKTDKKTNEMNSVMKQAADAQRAAHAQQKRANSEMRAAQREAYGEVPESKPSGRYRSLSDD